MQPPSVVLNLALPLETAAEVTAPPEVKYEATDLLRRSLIHQCVYFTTLLHWSVAFVTFMLSLLILCGSFAFIPACDIFLPTWLPALVVARLQAGMTVTTRRGKSLDSFGVK